MKTLLVSLAVAACSLAQTISLEQLKHQIPASAARGFRASSSALGKGDPEKAILYFHKAIAADPENASAHNDLGVLHLTSGQMEQALAEFQAAVRIQPKLVAAHINAGFAYLSLDRPQEAEASAQKALAIERTNHRGHFLFGWSLTIQHHYTAAALDSLRIASREFPEAHLAAADVLIHTGSLEGAREEVESYLASGATDQKGLAEAWLRFLTLGE